MVVSRAASRGEIEPKHQSIRLSGSLSSFLSRLSISTTEVLRHFVSRFTCTCSFPDGLFSYGSQKESGRLGRAAVLVATTGVSFASFWLEGGLCLSVLFLLVPFVTLWGLPRRIFTCYLCLLCWSEGEVSVTRSPLTLRELTAVVVGLLLTRFCGCCKEGSSRDKAVAGLTIFRLAILRLSATPQDPLISVFWVLVVCLWLLASGTLGGPAEDFQRGIVMGGSCATSLCAQYLDVVATLAEGSLMICDSHRRILWVCPKAPAELLKDSVGRKGGEGSGLICEDLVYPDDRAALLKVFELAEEQQKSKSSSRVGQPTDTGDTGGWGPSEDTYSENGKGETTTPSVLVRLNTTTSAGGPLRLFRVSVTPCGASNLFACLWRDATRLRRSAAVQEALVCGLSDCMSTVVWVFDPVVPQEVADAASGSSSRGPREAVSSSTAGPQGAHWGQKVGSENTNTRRSLYGRISQYRSSSTTRMSDGSHAALSLQSASVDGNFGGLSRSRRGPHKQQEQRAKAPQRYPRPYCNNEAEKGNNSWRHSSSHSSKSLSIAAGSCAASDVNVAPASVCPSFYQDGVSSLQSEITEALSRGLKTPWNARGVNQYENFRQFTVAGGAPLLQIERAGPLGFLLEYSKTILQRLTGRIVLGREPFSMLSSGDCPSLDENRETSWTDFFLEPGKTQLLECVRRLRTKGMSFCVELPYERPDCTIRWFRVAGYCSSYVPGVMWGIMQDTTACRTRLGCAQRSLHQFKTLFEAEFCGLGVVDTADTGLIVETSPGLDAFLGASAVGRPSICLLPEPVEKLTVLCGSCVGAPVVLQKREFPRAAVHHVTVTAVLDSESPGDLLFALKTDRRKQSLSAFQKILQAMQS